MCNHPNYRECECSDLPDDPEADGALPSGAVPSSRPIDTGRPQKF